LGPASLNLTTTSWRCRNLTNLPLKFLDLGHTCYLIFVAEWSPFGRWDSDGDWKELEWHSDHRRLCDLDHDDDDWRRRVLSVRLSIVCYNLRLWLRSIKVTGRSTRLIWQGRGQPRYGGMLGN